VKRWRSFALCDERARYLSGNSSTPNALQIPEQIVPATFQGLLDSDDDFYRRCPQASFDPLDVAAIDIGQLAEPFLSQAGALP